MIHVSAIIAAGGRGVRLGANRPKQLLPVGGRPILQRSVEAFLTSDRVHDIVVALPQELVPAPPGYLRRARVEVVGGGERRRDSVSNAFARVAARADVVEIGRASCRERVEV